MPTLKPINNYQLHLSSHPQFNEWQANISLRQDDRPVVDLRFVADPGSFASQGSINPTGISVIYVGIERYPWFVDVLRNEKPLVVVLYPASGTVPPRMLLQTGPEPIGEAEGA